jgi:NADPH:quinone reductase
VGSRVVTCGVDGGWAQLRAAAVADTAVVPVGVELATAAALPVAGVTALRALRAAGPLLGRRVLVTGASGGVGRFAVQLAALGGAHVIASVGASARGEGLRELGADEIVIGLEGLEHPVDVILDSVGGPQMVAAWALLAIGGSLQSIGWTSGEPAVFEQYATVGPAKSLTSFMMGWDLAEDLTTLLDLVAAGRLRVEIGHRASWEEITAAADALIGRRTTGKVVLDVA